MLTSPPWPFIGSCTRLIADVRNLLRLRTQLSVILSVTVRIFEPAGTGRYVLYDRCSYRKLSQSFSQKFLRISCTEPVYYAHGRIINFFIFWRRNARSHTKYPISDTIIGTSVLAVRGWLAEGFARGRVGILGLNIWFGRPKGLLAGVGITRGNFRRGRTLDMYCCQQPN